MTLKDVIPVDEWLIEDIKFVCEAIRAERVVLLNVSWNIFNK